jgi:RNA polymerase sigma factor (sigma-70 family)
MPHSSGEGDEPMGRATLKLVPNGESGVVSDEEIHEIAVRDRQKAFDLLVRKYRDRIYYHAMYITKDSEEAFDVAQDVFVRAYHEGRLFDPGFRTKAWLFRVCTNRCYNLVRDRNRRGGILERLGKSSAVLQVQHRAIDGVLKKELSDGMGRAMERLSPEHRTILQLRYFDDLSYQEIADVLQIKLGTVMSRLSRAKVRLHAILAEEDGE